MFGMEGRERESVSSDTQSGSTEPEGADAAAKQNPLRLLHEALMTGPLSRRYAKASPLGGSLWELSFTVQDLRTKVRSSQSQIINIDRAENGEVGIEKVCEVARRRAFVLGPEAHAAAARRPHRRARHGPPSLAEQPARSLGTAAAYVAEPARRGFCGQAEAARARPGVEMM